jgi:hypothetical protein
MRVTNGIPLGCTLLLLVHTVNCVQTLKAYPKLSEGAYRPELIYSATDVKRVVDAATARGIRVVYGARFRQKCTLEDVIGSHAHSLEALVGRVWHPMPTRLKLLWGECGIPCPLA